MKKTLDGTTLPGDGGSIVGVVRPPNQDNQSHGLAFGLRQPTGQVRWSFDDARSRELCRALARWSGAREQGLDPRGFYRREIALATGDDSKAKPIERCAVFGTP